MDKVGIYNPLTIDFHAQYDIDGNLNPKDFVVTAGEIVFFDAPLAEHIKIALIDHLLNLNWPKDGNVETAKARFREQITVKSDGT